MCSSSQQEPSLIPPESEGSVNQFHGDSHNITPDNILVNSLNSSYVKN